LDHKKPIFAKLQRLTFFLLVLSLLVIFMSGVVFGRQLERGSWRVLEGGYWLWIILAVVLISVVLGLAVLLHAFARKRVDNLHIEADHQHQTSTDLSESLRRMVMLNRVIATTTSSLDTNEILDTLCKEVASQFKLPQTAFALLNDERTELKVVAEYRHSDRPSALGEIIPVEGNPATQHVIETHQPLMLEDNLNDPRQAASHGLSRRRGTVSLLIVPILVQERVIGTLGLDSLEPRSFSPEEIVLMQSIASSVGQALENARLYDQLQQELAERRRIEERLRYEALHDSLTGLPNRTYFLDQVRRAIERARRKHNITALIFMDLDQFKLVNDSLGHHRGDTMLEVVSRRLEEAVRPGDLVARFGGDEFAVLLEDIKTAQDACRVCDRIQEALREPVDLEGHAFIMTASMGITMTSSRHQTAEEMLRDADTAMYRAKGSGKARYEIFREDMRVDLDPGPKKSPPE
jgi:diguanylate cyclase (GGDEF)-like protein